jgi:DNA-binding CsgD family transcriptional regulator
VGRLLEVVAAIEYDEANDALRPESLVLLADMLGASTVGYLVLDGHGPAVVDVCAERQPYVGRCEEIEQLLFANQWPFEDELSPGVRLMQDVMTRAAFRRTRLFNEVIRIVHDEPMAEVSLPARLDGLQRKILFCRSDDERHAFGERERRILEFLTPHFCRPLLEADARRRRQAAYGLTKRELEVLRLVSLGSSNGEVATELWISPLTVRTHLEHAFAKLGVHTRAEAVALAGPFSGLGPYQCIVAA